MVKKYAFLWFVGLLALGCTQAKEQSLIATYTLVELSNEQGKVDLSASEQGAFVRFDVDGRFNGNTGCNNFFGNYTANGANLLTNGVGMTRMMCAGGTMAVEDTLSDIFSGSSTMFSLQGDRLILQKGNKKATFVISG